MNDQMLSPAQVRLAGLKAAKNALVTINLIPFLPDIEAYEENARIDVRVFYATLLDRAELAFLSEAARALFALYGNTDHVSDVELAERAWPDTVDRAEALRRAAAALDFCSAVRLEDLPVGE